MPAFVSAAESVTFDTGAWVCYLSVCGTLVTKPKGGRRQGQLVPPQSWFSRQDER